ncbi:polysaccharide pyruvyl transferase family protein [Microbacterium sp. ARD31]|uniref:polysaccharide pyruvyl transferase family protein n=1 Tax=Microbacterium sp. ARD31 TaxID=2962576 RepID=UPI00288184B8|nr:polysaccharide pyruvyl transferase family protein [Microbacterium sp. ARD31]MDT0182962.1 polysaccharide pyruvyl transferase family protein [Microbacterium sp. ARD31]
MRYSIGAYDRFNFGDLLFPHAIDRYSPEPVSHISTTRVDLSERGGVKTVAVQDVVLSPGDSLIVGGGDVLSASWLGAWWHLQSEKVDFVARAANRLLPQPVMNEMARRALSGSWPLPFVPPPDICSATAVAYSSVSGSHIHALDRREIEYLRSAMQAARYISVRDRETQAILATIGVDAALAPDSVAVFGLHTPPTERLPRTFVLQASDQWVRPRVHELVNAINELAAEGWRVEFLSIGQVAGHSDAKALDRLRRAGARVTANDASSVSEIWEVIRNATTFSGSSLHGHIVSIANETPCVALGGVKKLEDYARTWSPDVVDVCTDVATLPMMVKQARSRPNDLRSEARLRAANSARLNLESMMEAVAF